MILQTNHGIYNYLHMYSAPIRIASVAVMRAYMFNRLLCMYYNIIIYNVHRLIMKNCCKTLSSHLSPWTICTCSGSGLFLHLLHTAYITRKRNTIIPTIKKIIQITSGTMKAAVFSLSLVAATAAFTIAIISENNSVMMPTDMPPFSFGVNGVVLSP